MQGGCKISRVIAGQQGLKSCYATWEQRGEFGRLPAKNYIQTIELNYFTTANRYFNSKCGLPAWEEGPFHTFQALRARPAERVAPRVFLCEMILLNIFGKFKDVLVY